MFNTIIKSISISLVVLAFTACGSDGGGSDDSSGLDAELVQQGSFIDSSVQGLVYETSSFRGETDENGIFNYLKGERVKFYIGSFFLGEAPSNALITPYSLYPNDETAAINVARLLQTLDADKDPSNGISLLNQEVFDGLDDAVSPLNADFENALFVQLGLNLDVSAEEAKKHLDTSISQIDTTAPVFTSANTASVYENQKAAITLLAKDSESSVSYFISGTDANSFNVDQTEGKVTFKVAPDYEKKKSYTFVAKAKDTQGNEATQDITIKVLDVDESTPDTSSPAFTSQNNISVNENQTSAITLVAVDNQPTITYSLSGTDANSLNVNTTSGKVTFKVAPDYESKKSYTFTAKATDVAGNFSTQNISISILDVNEGNLDRSTIRTVDLLALAQAQGQSPVAYLTSQFEQKDKANYVQGDQNIFVSTPHIYADDTWASQFDFSGVGWDSVMAGTLITNQHIVLAAHYARGVGAKISFLNKDGIKEFRTIVAKKFLRNYDSELGDACIEKLDAPVSDRVKVYPMLKSDITNDLSSLNGAPYIMTDKTAKAFPEKILALRYAGNTDYNVYNVVNWGKNSNYPDFMYHGAVGGDSGNPHFLYVNGELVIGSVLFGYGQGGMTGHFYGFQSMQDALLQAISDMN